MDFQQLSSYKGLLIGDFCTDIFIYGSCTRLSPEAPVPVFMETRRDEMDGMAGNVYNNLNQFPVDLDFLYSGTGSTKKRFIDEKSGQHILRVDDEKKFHPIDLTTIEGLYDYYIISDYCKGTVSNELINKIKSYNKPTFVDSKRSDLSIFEGFIIKINKQEYDNSNLRMNENLIVTLGNEGALWNNKRFPTKKVEVRDVSGAGDTFFSCFIAYYLETKDIKKSIEFANKCALQVIQKSGTSTINLNEIKNEIYI